MRAAALLALFWFLYLGGLGIFFPFYSLYLHENAGLSGSQVGLVYAMLPLTGIGAQLFWGQMADRSGSRMLVLGLLALGAAGGQLLIFPLSGFLPLLLGTVVLAVFHTAVLPMCVSVTFAAVRDLGPHLFGLVRAVGTVGFLVWVVGFPRLLHALQESRGLSGGPGVSEPGLGLMFPCIAALALLAAGVALAVPRQGAVSLRAERGDWRALLRHGPFVRLLAFALLAFLCLQGPMTLFPIFVREHGGTIDDVSGMWVLMLLLEIPLIALSGASLARFGPRGLLALGVVCGGVRWVVSGTAGDLEVIRWVQLLHGPTVAGLMVGGPLYVEAAVPERLRSTGQALYAILGAGVGGFASNVLAGTLLDRLDADAPALVGGLAALALAVLLPFLLPHPHRPDD